MTRLARSSKIVLLALAVLIAITLLSSTTLAMPLPAPDDGVSGAPADTQLYERHDGDAELDLVSRDGVHSSRVAFYGACYTLDESVWDDTSYLSVKTKDTICAIYSDDSCSDGSILVKNRNHVDVPRVTPGPVAFRCWKDEKK
ncbi:hypothetical protein DFQ26_008879 [Actinomortierella ambigua]|nr:hypothetical protein DFQ26_008879 [Actinomortierella ambigua]